MQVFSPSSTQEVVEIVTQAAGEGRRIEPRGGGTRLAFGAPRNVDVLDMRGLAGIIDYDPPELVLTARAGTPLRQIRELVAQSNQMLAFDPWEDGALYGCDPVGSTIGGVIAAGVSGPARIGGGAARDHLLGFTAVSGRGERFIAGAKVVKNVTGYDLSKIVTGSWGRLAALAEVTLKVLPKPPASCTLVLHGLSDAHAVAAMSLALGSATEVNAAAHLPGGKDGGEAMTLLLLRGVEPSVAARRDCLVALLAEWGAVDILEDSAAVAAWSAVREVGPLSDSDILWRVIVPPSAAVEVVTSLSGHGVRHVLDWGGNLVWIAGDAEPAVIRALVSRAGGHATLVRAPTKIRQTISALHPRPAAVAALEARVRRAFDPLEIFETGRFPETHDAD